MNPRNCTLAAFFLHAFLFLSCYQYSHAQYDFKWQTDGTVNSAVIADDVLYIGGSFSYVGKYRGNMVGVDITTGAWDEEWPVVNARVFSIIPDGAGGWYIGGSFTEIDGISRRGVARLMPDKTVDQAWNANISGGVNSMILSGSILYIGGSFTTAGGQPRNNLAALDANGLATSWNPGANAIVRAIASTGTLIYAGGDFTTVGGQARSRMAAIDMSGTVTSWNPDIVHGSGSAVVNSIIVTGSQVFIGGFFTNAGGLGRNNIALLDAATDTNNALPWNPGANGTVSCLLMNGTTIYVGGLFTVIGGQVRRRIAELDLNTGSVLAWDPNANSGVLSLYKIGNIIYAGGQFTSIGGQTRRKLAALDATINTNNATAWDPNAGNGWELYTILPAGNSMIVGGSFTSVNGDYRNNIAAIDLSTNTILPWNPNANGNINVIKTEGNTLYAGGDFTNIGGQARSRIAALDLTVNTGNALAWNPGANASVRTIALQGSTVYAGGDFTSIGGQSRNRLAALDANGIATAWNPDVNAVVRTIDIANNVIYAGGDFTSAGGQSRNRIAAIDVLVNTSNALAWNPGANNTVRTILVEGGTVYTGGDFTFIGGQSRNRMAALDATGNVTAWTADANGTVRSIAIVNRVLYMAGDFNVAGGQGRNNVAAISMDANTGNLLAWNPLPGITTGLNTITVSGPYAYAGGSFTVMSSTFSFFLSYMPSLEFILSGNQIFFTVENRNLHCTLRWSVSEEEPGTSYEIQRSEGNPVFNSITRRIASMSNESKQYEVEDLLPGPGLYYYRIKITSPGGSTWYSPVRHAFTGMTEVKIFPTVLDAQELSVIVPGSHYSISIHGVTGQLQLNRQLEKGLNHLTGLSFRDGIYYYAIRNSQGYPVKTGRLLMKSY